MILRTYFDIVMTWNKSLHLSKKNCSKLFFLGFLNTNTAPHQHPQMANYGLMDQVG